MSSAACAQQRVPETPQPEGLGQGALGTDLYGQGQTETARCLLCALHPPCLLPSGFFPTACLHPSPSEAPLPEESTAGTSTSAPVSAGNTGPPCCLPLPGLTDPLSPRCLTHAQVIFLLSSKCDPWASLCTKPPDPRRHPHWRRELVCKEMAAGQGGAVMGLFTFWTHFPPIFLAVQLPVGTVQCASEL